MKKKIAVIGYGGQGGWHCKQILKSDVAELAGIYDINPARGQLAKEDNIHVYESADALLKDTDIDAVVVATPNDSHKELVIRALNAGKNVICEKPVEVSVEAFDEMCAAAERAGKLFTVHQNRRWDVDFLAMKQIIGSGQIGDVIRIESRIHGSRGIPSDWRGTKAQGGGMILDWGVHLIDQVLQLFEKDKIQKVYCNTTNITNKEVDDGFRLNLYFENGKTAYIEVGTYNFLAMPRFYLQCENGSALISDWTKKAHVAKLKAWNEKDVLPVQTAAGITKTMAPRDEVTLDEYDIERPLSDVHDFYRNFCAALDGKEEMLITHKQVRRVLRVMELAFESSEQGQAVDCNV
ncbi:MAG: Gfo/Idh/MocA family oxidoreductase [Lachnospiraceae bacterium]|nr:Gfo/Idh/MocA family oxidoreductase [Lachnospiraceae bacterium]